MGEQHFCTCTSLDCGYHPNNHGRGCDPCMKKNLAQGKMPSCLFHLVHGDISEVTDYTVAGFVDFFLKHRDGAALAAKE